MSESAQRQITRLLASGLDWSRAMHLAERHAVLPLLHYQLHRLDIVPDQIRQQLRQAYEVNALRNALLTSELCKLQALFSQHDLATIALKGPALSLALYDNLLLRQFGDLDLFIRKSDLGRMTELLEANNYHLTLTPREQKYYFKHRYHYSFIRNDDKVVVEVHWAFTPRCWPYPLGDDDLFGRSASVTFQETSIPALSPDHTLLVLCAHGAKERWARLQLVVDVAELIRRDNIDWQWVLAETQRMRRERVLLLGTGLARSLLGAELPDLITERIDQDEQVAALVGQLRTDFFGDHWPLGGVRLHRYFLNVWPHSSDRMRYLFQELRGLPGKLLGLAKPSEPDQTALRLPAPIRFLHYMIRPFRLAFKYRNPRRLFRKLSEYI